MDLSPESQATLLHTLRARFEKHRDRHPDLSWNDVEARLVGPSPKLWSLDEMERTGGEPDAIGRDEATGEIVFCDCAAESPKGRRSLCYDRQALDARKEAKPEGSAVEMAAAMGVELLDETAYRRLQTLGEFDLKTSSWLATPTKIRELGGAIFADRRYDTVFVFHNGAESYYAARGFCALLKV